MKSLRYQLRLIFFRTLPLGVLSVWMLTGTLIHGQSLPDDALNFVFANQSYVDCGNDASLQITGSITVEAWIRASAWGATWTRGPIICKSQVSGYCGYELRCGGSAEISFNLGKATKWDELRSGANVLTLNRWYHVCATYDGTTSKIYVNGILVSSLPNTGSINGTTNPLLIGANSDYLNQSPSTSNRIFQGDIDEVRIWNVARTQAEIQAAMYNALTPANEPNLIAYYQMDAGSGTSLADKKGTNTGTLTNGTGGQVPSWVESYAMVVPVPSAATGVSSSGFTAHWSAPAVGTVTSYKLDVSTSSTFATFVTGYNNLDCGISLSHGVTGLTPSTTYYFRARADKTSVTGTGANYHTPVSVTTPCTNPASGGTIGAAQSICQGFAPAPLTSLTAPAGYDGTLEYKWQYSTTGAASGFADIASSNAAGYSPGILSVTTWYKRLSRVTCSGTWPAAGESDVVQITVNAPSFASTSTVASLQATGQNIKWYDAATGGNLLTSGTLLLTGTHHYYASQTVNGAESTTRLDVTSVVDATPCKPTGAATQSFPPGATVASLSATGSTIRWYSSASGGTALSPTTPLVTATDYYATQTVDCTESATRMKVTVTLIPD